MIPTSSLVGHVESEPNRVHDVFHVSMLRKYVHDESHVIDYHPLELKQDLTFEEAPIRIVDRKDQVLRRRIIPYVKVQWQHHNEREATWELEEDMRQKYPHLFDNSAPSNPSGQKTHEESLRRENVDISVTDQATTGRAETELPQASNQGSNHEKGESG